MATHADHPSSITLHRDDYTSRAEYLREYRYLCGVYGFRRRVCGGWIFYDYASDYFIACQQR